MKGLGFLIPLAILSAIGCTSTPKREMRQPTAEEFSTPPAHMYTTPPDVPRDQPLLTPKSTSAPLNPGPGPAGVPGPSPTPGVPAGLPR